jgi:hypothetical protein
MIEVEYSGPKITADGKVCARSISELVELVVCNNLPNELQYNS